MLDQPQHDHELQRLNETGIRDSSEHYQDFDPYQLFEESDSTSVMAYSPDVSENEDLDAHGPAVTETSSHNAHRVDEPPATEPTARPTNLGQTAAVWNIHWRSPMLMMGLVLSGICMALSHNFYYRSLDGTVVSSETSQQWAIRIGTALAFLTQSSLASAVGIAYTQRIWVTVKEKPISLQNIDKVFSLGTDPFSFFSLEILTSVKVLCLLAASMW